MDLSVYSLPKLKKEKRERQPNWTDPEKQLLLSLTRMHQSILENKGSDTMTIKRKSQAWDEIALHMQAAGFNRSKDRLKQQLGRIRAASVKRAKEAFERSLSSSTSLNISLDRNTSEEDSPNIGEHTSPICVREEIHIKVEKMPSMDNEDDGGVSENQQPPSSSSASDTVETNVNDGNNSRNLGQSMMRFVFENIQSLSDIGNVNHSILNETNSSEGTGHNSTDGLPVTTNSNTLVMSNASIDTCSMKDLVDDNSNAVSGTNAQRNRQQSRHIMSTCIRAREQRLRQIHIYRMAVERERLRSLKVQQKRDRILHRKDVQIQNLKLQILRNITNQNPDGNYFNF